MKGCRPLTDDEVRRVHGALTNLRDRTLFLLGVTTGFRISELLSMDVEDVHDGREVRDRVRVARRNVKGSKSGQSVSINPQVAKIIALHIEGGELRAGDPLFKSQKGGAITRQRAWQILKAGFEDAGLLGAEGELGTHSLRKTFARYMWERSDNDIFFVQKALRHASPASTVAYLSFADEELDEAVRSLTFDLSE